MPGFPSIDDSEKFRGCSVETCSNPAFARGWCRMHYARWYRNGRQGDPANIKQDPGYRLTAAAPAMLEALKHAQHLMWQYGFSENDLRPIREAITKAKGA